MTDQVQRLLAHSNWIIESLRCFNIWVCPGLNPIQRANPKRVRNCSRFGLLGIVITNQPGPYSSWSDIVWHAEHRKVSSRSWPSRTMGCGLSSKCSLHPRLAKDTLTAWVGGLVPIISRCSKSTKGIWQPLGSSMFLHVIDCTLDSSTYNTVLRHLRQQFHPNTSYINDTTLFCFES